MSEELAVIQTVPVPTDFGNTGATALVDERTGKLYTRTLRNEVVEVTSSSNSSFIASGSGETTVSAMLTRLGRKVFGIVIDGGGSAITTGVKGDLVVPWTGVIKQWTVLADQSGSIVVDVWKDTYANAPPTVADSIAGTEKPTLSSAVKNQDTSLTTWTTAVTAGDVIRFNVDSVDTVTRVTVMLEMDL